MLSRTVTRRARSATWPMRSSATTRCWCAGPTGEAYNIGTETPEISMAELADSLAAIGRRPLGLHRQGRTGASDDPAYLTDNPNRRCPVIEQGPDGTGVRPAGDARGRIATHLIWYRGQPRGGGQLMKMSIIGTGYVGLVSGVGLAERATTWFASISTRRRSTASIGANRRSSRRDSKSCWGRSSATGCEPRRDLRASGVGLGSHDDRRRDAVRRQGDRPDVHRGCGAARSARRWPPRTATTSWS